eukprot:SAG11_NODE_1868_length_4151_cov_8.778134_3_plen_54_part_00
MSTQNPYCDHGITYDHRHWILTPLDSMIVVQYNMGTLTTTTSMFRTYISCESV